MRTFHIERCTHEGVEVSFVGHYPAGNPGLSALHLPSGSPHLVHLQEVLQKTKQVSCFSLVSNIPYWKQKNLSYDGFFQFHLVLFISFQDQLSKR